ncbi:MAG: hypothetical protein HZB85_01885 [Deltaproteobacteria bacterium]|nr:hypothetical protein [Deltaproteobacteria bacterium]
MGENEIKELAKAIAEELKFHQGCQLTKRNAVRAGLWLFGAVLLWILKDVYLWIVTHITFVGSR